MQEVNGATASNRLIIFSINVAEDTNIQMHDQHSLSPTLHRHIAIPTQLPYTL